MAAPLLFDEGRHLVEGALAETVTNLAARYVGRQCVGAPRHRDIPLSVVKAIDYRVGEFFALVECDGREAWHRLRYLLVARS